MLCRRRLLGDKKKPANLKATNQAPKGMSKNNKQNGPNLWIDHDQVGTEAMFSIINADVVNTHIYVAIYYDVFK